MVEKERVRDGVEQGKEREGKGRKQKVRKRNERKRKGRNLVLER